ncbi:MAG: phosphoribosyl-ATP diphosphatase [Eggerthellaceae bacterium]|jgi:phosphoribosyl-ATP pyrophosphohydrolase
MPEKTYLPSGESQPSSQIGATLEALAHTIAARRGAGEESYTYRLLNDHLDLPLKKLVEEANEVVLAAKDCETAKQFKDDKALSDETDHLRYEAGDLVYHLLVVLERYGISIDELAAELNNRMTQEERPEGGVRLLDEYVRRGK